MIKLLLLPLMLVASHLSAKTVVVVNEANANDISKKYVARIFKGKKRAFPDGSKAEPVSQVEENAVTKEFAEKVVGKNLEQLRSYRARGMFSGKLLPIAELKSDEEVVRFIKNNPHGIGFVDSLSDTSGVRVINM